VTTASIALTSKMRPDAPILVDVVARARLGDEEALTYVFDHVFYDVYHFVFLATRNRGEAERVTRDALNRLPAMVRGGRYQSVEELRHSLVQQAERRLHITRRNEAPVGRMNGVRSTIRHVVLIASAAIAAISALLLLL
jgi:hypothetical protein